MSGIFMRPGLLAALVSAFATVAAQAALVGMPGGTGFPPATLGPYTLTPFAPDPRPLFELVSDVPTPLGGTIRFERGLSHRRIGLGWGTWSHGYSGDVYVELPPLSKEPLTIDLRGADPDSPEGVGAFLFYIQPFGDIRQMQVEGVSASGDVLPLSQVIEGSFGAAAFQYYATESDLLSEVRILSRGDILAIGTFHIAAIPEPGAAVLLCLFALLTIRTSRHADGG